MRVGGSVAGFVGGFQAGRWRVAGLFRVHFQNLALRLRFLELHRKKGLLPVPVIGLDAVE